MEDTEDTVLLGEGASLRRIATADWKRALEKAPARIAPRLAFMSEDHHRVRNFAVTRLPGAGPDGLPPETIAEALGLAPEHCAALLDDLERHLFFLVRDLWGTGTPNVTWAFPNTVEPTPHRIRFSTGERTFGA